MEAKFDDYFFYAFDQWDMTEGENNKNDCSSTQECGHDGLISSCCVNVVMAMEGYSFYGEEAEKTYHSMFRCMNTAVVASNWEMTMGDMTVQMECLENNEMMDMVTDIFSSMSGSVKLMALAGSMVASSIALIGLF